MSRHFASLKCITTSSSQFTGAMVESTLESCLVLHLCEKDFGDPDYSRKWICRALETFAISIVVDTDIDAEISAQSHGVFEQLAQLSCLTNLRFGFREKPPRD
ncbi:hypothetical protein BGZ93_001418 [Podila epicladia]|nr:hypothetical protein BGZ93_001418 [Podila epicladia]